MQFTVLNGVKSEPIPITAGILQGSNLGSTLFTILLMTCHPQYLAFCFPQFLCFIPYTSITFISFTETYKHIIDQLPTSVAS